MSLQKYPDLLAFFAASFADTDLETDEQTTREFGTRAAPEKRQRVLDQAKRLLAAGDLPLGELGSEANRWFGADDEARAWLQRIAAAIDSAGEGADAVIVKDSNGAVLAEGDSVMVIKDLKVRGGSSDLKRGTLIKKIHLIDDAENIECRVDGSTLVLKTCFLKKA